MGKKNSKKANYDPNALSRLAYQICNMRKPVKKGEIPEIRIKFDGLEKAILELEKKDREILEKFWGLIPGKPDHSKHVYSPNRKMNDVAYNNMLKTMLGVAKKMLCIEYLYLYDKEVETLVSNLSRKIDKSGAEQISDIDSIKYLMIFLIFFLRGPKLCFESPEDEINLELEEDGKFDEYALLKVTWEDSAKFLEDHSINLKLLMEMINMFDLKDVVSMRNFVRLPIKKQDANIESEVLTNFHQIRLFKEKIFPYGEWNVTTHLIYYDGSDNVNLEKFAEELSTLRSNWEKLRLFEKGSQIVKTSTGDREIKTYEIGEFEFTDIYELMFLYVSRSIA